MTRLSLALSVLTLRLRREHDPREREPRASAGQILVLFALMSTALFGILGLSVDIGYAVSQRRAMQNAADLAAIAGAHAIAEYRADNLVSARTSVQAVIDGNQTREGSPAVEECVYLNDAFSPQGDCEGHVPADATGFRVTARETHDTFFIQVVPGVSPEVTTRATATARVELLFRAGMDSPFIVCGYDNRPIDGDLVPILLNDETVNPDAIHQTYRIVGDNIAKFPFDDDGGVRGPDISGEETLGTNFANPPDLGQDYDTDRGGVEDGAEVYVYDTDPTNPDDEPIDADGETVSPTLKRPPSGATRPIATPTAAGSPTGPSSGRARTRSTRATTRSTPTGTG